jgi:MurNAc alpha-1-phosphate uridylyltransferase
MDGRGTKDQGQKTIHDPRSTNHAPRPESAIVLAAGMGTRLKPLTDRIPKPLVEVAGRTLIDRALDRIAGAGIARAVVNVSYKAEMIEGHLRTRRSPAIRFSREAQPLETGGGIRHALALLGKGPFFSLNADVITLDAPGRTPFLQRLAEAWREEADALLLVQPTARAVGYDGRGDFDLDAAGRLTRRAGEAAPYVFTGVQLLHPRLFANAPEGPFSMNLLYAKLMREGRLFGLAHEGGWLHVGDPEGLAAAERFCRSANAGDGL